MKFSTFIIATAALITDVTGIGLNAIGFHRDYATWRFGLFGIQLLLMSLSVWLIERYFTYARAARS